MTPLTNKLHLKPGYKCAFVNAPKDYLKQLRELPNGATLAKRADADCDLVHLFVTTVAEMDKYLDQAVRYLKLDGVFWISYPKKSSGVQTDISRDHGWEPLYKLNLRPVAAISIDDTWSALRFRPEERVRSK